MCAYDYFPLECDRCGFDIKDRTIPDEVAANALMALCSSCSGKGRSIVIQELEDDIRDSEAAYVLIKENVTFEDDYETVESRLDFYDEPPF